MKRVFPVVLLALACGVAGWYAHQLVASSGRGICSSETTRGLSTNGQESVVGMGRIEPVGGVIDVGAMMGDRLGRLLVEEGEQVEKGAPLAELESRALRKLELDAATSQLQNAEGRLDVEQRLADVKIDAARLGVKKAEAAQLTKAAQEQKVKFLTVGLTLAQKDQQRLAGLSKELVTDQERERQALLVQQAESELESAQALLKQMVCTSDLGVEAANLELAAAIDAKKQLPFVIPVDTLRVSYNVAEAQYARTQVIAPCSGTILKTYIRPGETIGAKPILQMAELQRMIVTAEVYENAIQHVHPGQHALITSKAFQPPYDRDGVKGKVTRVGRMISTPVLKGVDPFAPADRHVVEVRVELDDDASRQAATLSNLQVDVRFPKE